VVKVAVRVHACVRSHGLRMLALAGRPAAGLRLAVINVADGELTQCKKLQGKGERNEDRGKRYSDVHGSWMHGLLTKTSKLK
jgi:hypothetical protein